MDIQIRDLHYSVGKKQILKGVNAAFSGKNLYGIIGPNGCGKTTMLRHLYRDLPVHENVFLEGKPLESYSRRGFARKVAVMMQHQDLSDEGLTVYDVVQMGRYPYKKFLSQYNTEDENIVNTVLEQTSLNGFRGRKIHTLSGGELQRVMMAKCLAQQPEVIILDEPTNHLDIRFKLELMETLKSFDGLVIMTIHDLNLAARFCDRVFMMKEGVMVDEGTADEIFREEKLQDLFDIRIQIIRHEGQIFVGI